MAVQVSPDDLRRFREGDETVLESLVGSLGPAIEATLTARFPMLRAYAEDLLIESLYRLWVRRRDFDPEQGSLFVWWSAIAHNAARDLLRAGWQQARFLEATLEAGQLEQLSGDEAILPVERAGEAEQTFWEVFADLPDTDQRILLSHARVNGEGPWAADLAGELGMTAGTIRVRRLRVMERLRKEMKRRGLAVRADSRNG
jgi:RNA polymerase sigma factor (sigma-70 family)